MNVNFKCEQCGAEVQATIWDELVSCHGCQAEYMADVAQVAPRTLRWDWELQEDRIAQGTRNGDDLDFDVYVTLAMKLADMVKKAQEEGPLLKVVDAARKLDVTFDTVINMAEDNDLCVNVGVQVGGLGGPVGELPRTEWDLEFLG